MKLAIFYTPRSKQTLASVYNFIKNKFGVKSANKFAVETAKIIELIAHHPYMYKASFIDPEVRIGLISKQTSLFYRVTDTSVHLLFFWDNRQEPVMPSL